MQNIEYRLNQLERKLNNIIRVGKVSSVNTKNCTVKVVFEEFENNIVSHDLPVVVKQTLKTKDYYLPEVNEQVVCIFLPTGFEVGFVLGAPYNNKDVPVINDANTRSVTFNDDTSVSYNTKTHELNINITNDDGKIQIRANNINIETKKASIKAEQANIEADEIKITATSKITGDVTIDGDVKATGTIEAQGNMNAASISDNQGSMIQMRTIYNSHAHANDGTSPPIPLM